MPPSGLDVFFNVDKPCGPTSHDVVARLRRASGVRRIGHAGTLDPLATGVLVVAVGRATRLIEYLADADKAYVAQITFGVETDTYDAEGTVVERRDASGLTQQQVEEALGGFRGTIQQRPPAHSAIRVGGKRLYEMARAGQTVEAPVRTVHIARLEVRDWRPPVAVVFVECSKGTYVRSLAHDLGQVVGLGAQLSALSRTRVGRFTLDRATPLERLETMLRDGAWSEVAVPLEAAVEHLPAIVIESDEARTLANGVSIRRGTSILRWESDGSDAATLCRAVSREGRLIAIVEESRRENEVAYRPRKVLTHGD